jgi:hypothetical protein
MKLDYIFGIIIIILIILIIFKEKEHLTGNEAVFNISKVYADASGTAAFNNIKINGNIDVSGASFGNINSTGNINSVSASVGYGGLSVTHGSDEGIGGYINLINSKKTQGGTAKKWTIFNMNSGGTGSYNNALEFWKYDANTGSGNRVFTLEDNGPAIFSGNVRTNLLSVDPSIEIRNETKGDPNIKKYAIFNSGGGENGLQFWQYNNAGAAIRKPFEIKDNGEVHIGGDLYVKGKKIN